MLYKQVYPVIQKQAIKVYDMVHIRNSERITDIFKIIYNKYIQIGGKSMSTPFKRILYGGDYNPNQWSKDVWQEDMRIFKDAHINTATINVFSWAKIQPSEHEYYFDELDEIVDMLSKENYDIVFATSTAALPGWMVR